MKRKKSNQSAPNIRFRLTLNVLFAICAAVVFVAAGVLLAYGAPRYAALSAALLAAVFAVVAWVFQRRIYRPIKKLEQAVRAVSDVENIMDFELDIDESSELYEVSASVNKMIRRLKEFAEREYTATILVKQAELNALQTQINPHFLYNTLDSIRGLALKEGHQRIAVMTKALSGLFRYSISNTDDMSTLREEIKNVENYLTIQQMRFSGKFIFIKDIDLAREQDILDAMLPKLTIQPIVENAVFHGLETKLGNGTIILNAYTTEKRLVISVEDDGVGIEAEALDRINERLRGRAPSEKESKSTSLALGNVNDRIKLFFGDEYGVKVYSTPHMGTTVELSLPLEKQIQS